MIEACFFPCSTILDNDVPVVARFEERAATWQKAPVNIRVA